MPVHYFKMSDVNPDQRLLAEKMAAEKGYTTQEAQQMLLVKDSSYKLKDVMVNHGPF